MVVCHVFYFFLRFENWRRWVHGGSIFNVETGVIDVDSVEAERDMYVPGLWVDFDESGVDGVVEIDISLRASIAAGWKDPTFVNIDLIFSVHRVGSFDCGWPLIVISSSLQDQSNVDPSNFRTYLNALPDLVFIGTPSMSIRGLTEV